MEVLSTTEQRPIKLWSIRLVPTSLDYSPYLQSNRTVYSHLVENGVATLIHLVNLNLMHVDTVAQKCTARLDFDSDSPT